LPGHNISFAVDISDVDAAGQVQVVGSSALAFFRNHGYRPVRWTLESDGAGGWRVAGIEALSLLKKFPDAQPSGLNNAGDVVGYYLNRRIVYDAAKWQTAGKLQTLPSPSAGGARARAINNAGQIVGSVWDDALFIERAALWRRP
jgi:uncharacterized membrane protein